MTGGGEDLHGWGRTDSGARSGGQGDGLELRRFGGHHTLAAPGRSLDQHRITATDRVLVAAERNRLLHLDYGRQAARLFGFTDLIAAAPGAGMFAARIFESKGRVETNLAHQGKRGFEVRVGFVAETDNYVSR